MRAGPGNLPGQLYSVPVLITGWTSLSAHSTISRLLTIDALRSSSSSTTFFADSSESAISHHRHGAVHDLLPRGDDRFGLLAPQHRLRDLRRVGEVGEPRLLDDDAGLVEPRLQLALEGAGDGLRGAEQRGLARSPGVSSSS